MRALLLAVSVLSLGAGSAFGAAAPAAPPPPPKTFMASAEIQALIAQAAQRAPGNPLVIQPIVGLLPYVANLEYRTAAAPAAVHELEAELFYVVDGSGTLVTGGKLAGETRANPENLRGTGIDGGTARTVAKGDVFIVPEGTPHWFSHINGTLVMMSVHVPHQAGNPR